MGVYENLLKKKIINENEDGSVSVNHQELDNVINSKPVQQPNMWQQINDMTNSMNDRINESINENMKLLPTFIQERVKPFQSMTLEQKKRFVDNQQAETAKIVSNKLSRPLWEQIQDFANDTGRTIENTWLGTKHGIEDSGNYIDSMLNGEKTQREKELTRVLFSDLSNEQKQMYIAQNSAFGLLLNDQSSEDIAKAINDSVLPIKIDANKIEEARNQYKSMLPINLTDENLNTMRQYIKDNYDKDKVEEIAKTDVKAEERQKENEKIAQNIEEQTNPVAKKLAEVAPSVGQMLPGMALSTVNPALGTTYFITSAGGGYLQDAKNRGMDETQSKIYATAMGIMEGLTEKISVGNLKKAGKAMKTAITAGKGIVKEEAKQIATNSIKDAIKNYGIGIAENTIQEAIMEPIQETMAGLVADKADWDNMPQRMLDSGINGGIVAVITGGGEIGINSCVAVMNKIQNGEVPTQQEIKIAYDDYAKAVGEEKAQNDFKEGAKNAISAQNQQTTIENKPSNTQEQQITPPVQKNVSNQNVVTNESKGKSFEDIVDESMANYEYNEVKSPLQNRDIKTIGKETKVNAYQYDNPEVKPYFQQMAQMIGEDVGNIASEDNRKTTKGGGTTLNTNISAIEKLHNEMGYSYNQIIDGIVNIIDDHGKENNALSKKLEIIIDDQLRNGYVNSYGKYINPNEEYINLINNPNQDEQSKINLPIKEISSEASLNLPTKGEEINWNKIERPEGKFRKHYQSIIESSNTTAEAKAIAKELMGADTYVPESNKKLINKADARISNTNPNTELNSLYSRVMNNEKVSDIDIAVGERLIEYYSKIGDKEHLLDAIHATAMAGTQAGRTVQAMALLNHMTPQGQVTWLQRSIDKANTELQDKFKNKKNVPQFELTQDMVDKVLKTNSKEEMFSALDDIYEELGQQVPKTKLEQIDEWRYFSMLANLKTHGRNMIGNTAMHITQRVKDKVAGVIEGTVAKFNPKMERTHTIVPASKEVKQFAKNDVKNIDVQTQMGMNENKYNPQSRLQNSRRTFKSEVMEKTLGKLFDINSTALEVEDNIGLKSMYVKALSDYITANKIDVNNITDAQLSKARQHAIKSAQEATFHQASALATALNQMGKKNNITKFALDATVPFKKTPINVAKAGAQYSPVGLIKSAVYDTAQLRKGNITINQYIDNISKGLTGTGIAFLGYALAEAGILKASGSDDDKKEKYDEQQGKQTYSIEIGGKTYSLDWLSPVGIPLFIGVEANEQFNQAKKEKNTKSSDDDELLSKILKSVANIANATSNAMNPMSEMSMISGLTNVLSSYNKENAVGDMIVNAGKSYVNQFVPTALGQLARTTDDYERTTTSTKTGTLEKAFDSTVNQIKSKIPGLRQTLPVKTDIWGKEVKQSENLPFRAFSNFVNPATVKDVSTDKVDKELNSLYAKIKESSIIPKTIEKTFSINGTDYRMTNDEYAKYSKDFGKTAHNILNSLVDSKEYKEMTDEQKQKAIENTYSYAKEVNKMDYAKKVNEEVKPSTLYNTMKALGNTESQGQYLSYVSKTAGMDKESEKNSVLLDSDFDDTTKAIIYENTTGKDDKVFNIIKTTIKMNQYLDYKIKNSNKEFQADKDKNGNSISGSAKKKIYNYINSNITGYENRLIMLASQYKLSKAEQQKIVDYINKNSKTNEEVIEKLEKFSQNFQVKDGKVYFK